MDILNIAAYRFITLTDLVSLRERIVTECRARNLRGTVLLATEGINLFLAGRGEDVRSLQTYLDTDTRFAGLDYKESESSYVPFNRLIVKIKKEIITLGDPTVRPNAACAPYLSAEQLAQWLREQRDFVLLDTRNTFEYTEGSFTGAVHVGNDSFREFPDRVRNAVTEWRDKPVVTFCTGGIRCEKAALLLQQLGVAEVYQLRDGILGYFAQVGGENFQGHCFVFDQRLALRDTLEPLNATPSANAWAAQRQRLSAETGEMG